jgi:hypothetical protein
LSVSADDRLPDVTYLTNVTGKRKRPSKNKMLAADYGSPWFDRQSYSYCDFIFEKKGLRDRNALFIACFFYGNVFGGCCILERIRPCSNAGDERAA